MAKKARYGAFRYAETLNKLEPFLAWTCEICTLVTSATPGTCRACRTIRPAKEHRLDPRQRIVEPTHAATASGNQPQQLPLRPSEAADNEIADDRWTLASEVKEAELERELHHAFTLAGKTVDMLGCSVLPSLRAARLSEARRKRNPTVDDGKSAFMRWGLPVDIWIECEICQVCCGDDQPGYNDLLRCDHCLLLWHRLCLTPALAEVPKGAWLCHACTFAGQKARSSEGAAPRHERRLRTKAMKHVMTEECARASGIMAVHRHRRLKAEEPSLAGLVGAAARGTSTATDFSVEAWPPWLLPEAEPTIVSSSEYRPRGDALSQLPLFSWLKQ